MFKVNSKDTRTTPVASLLLTLNRLHPCSSFSIANFEQVNADWNDLFSITQVFHVKKFKLHLQGKRCILGSL